MRINVLPFVNAFGLVELLGDLMGDVDIDVDVFVVGPDAKAGFVCMEGMGWFGAGIFTLYVIAGGRVFMWYWSAAGL